MERHLMMAAINNAAKQGKKFEGIETITYSDHDDCGGFENVTDKFLGRIDVYSRITMVHLQNTDNGDEYEVPLYRLTDESIERLYEQSEVYGEVRCDYYNEQDGWWCIDTWKTDDDNEEGEVVGWVDGTSGNIYYKHETAMSSAKVREVALAKQAEVRKAQEAKRYLMDETLIMMADDIYKDVYNLSDDNMDYNRAAEIVRDLAYKFEKELDWQGSESEQRDYLIEMDKFEQREMAKLRKKYC